jgi:hypothetical protein
MGNNMSVKGKNILAFGFNDPFVLPTIPELSRDAGVNHIHWITNALGSDVINENSEQLSLIDMQVALNAKPGAGPLSLRGDAELNDELFSLYSEMMPVVMKMMDRMEKHGPKLNYYQRKKRYHDLFFYWLSFLKEYRIDYFIIVDVPHEMTDYVLAEQCRILGIPTLSFTQVGIDAVLPVGHYKEVGTSDQRRWASLSKVQLDQLSEVISTRVAIARGEDKKTKAKPFYANQAWMKTHEKNVRQRQQNRILAKLSGVFKMLQDPAAWKYLYYLVWQKPVVEKNIEKKYWRRYASRCVPQVDFDRPYVYLPLHYQPEMTTSPLAEEFNDQYLMAEVLLAAFPEEVDVYVKEYPRQRLPGRSLDYFDYFPYSDRIKYIPISVESSKLQKHALAVATATGTAGFEALWNNKPVLVFGNAYYQSAQGAFRVRTVTDAVKAARRIMKGPALTFDMEAFMRSLEQSVLPCNLNAYWSGASFIGLSPEDNSRVLLTEIKARLQLV